ncbi:MAG: PAS domain-containing protein [Lachnospiraceae bacterium]|nr:PAS domain-containing protein [Lachnospiraceae bacterium]
MFEPVKLNYVSESLSRITGYTGKEVLEDQEGEYTELLLPEDRETFLEASMRLMEYPHVEQTYYRILAKDGREVPVVDIGQSVRGDDGRMYGYSTVQEIEPFTDHAEAKAIGQNHEVMNLLQRMPFAMGIYRYDGEKLSVSYINDSFRALFGTDKAQYEDLLSAQIYPLLSQEDVSSFERRLKEMQSGADFSAGRASMHGRDCMLRAEYQLYLLQRQENENIAFAACFKEIPGGQEESKEPAVSYIEVRTFGSFSVSLNGEELRFRSEKARELLAILVDFRGDFVNQGALISRLWPGEAVNKLTLARLRKTFKNLQDELMKYGREGIIESQKGHRRIVPEKVDCDYFAYCTGKPQYQHLYQGRYMTEYAWAEETLTGLNRLKEEQLLQMSNSRLTRYERNKSENKNASEVP